MAEDWPTMEMVFQQSMLVDNPHQKEDYEIVQSFLQLTSRPSRPIDTEVVPRLREDFLRMRRLLPGDFFEPFNTLLDLVGMPEMMVEPEMDAIRVWNNHEFAPRLLEQASSLLDGEGSSRLVPILVWVFLNLEHEARPSTAQDWTRIDVITVPGSRNYDRTAEAFRAYIRTRGGAALITSGRAPYYDPTNSGVPVTEAQAYAAYLRLLGVPSHHIYPEYASHDTQENAEFITRAIKAIEQDHQGKVRTMLLVTSPFHLARYRLNVESVIDSGTLAIDRVYAIGSRSSRYWAETYFLADARTGTLREPLMRAVFNEYFKIAFDICAQKRPLQTKGSAGRGGPPP